MKVSEYLHQANMDIFQLSELLGYKSSNPVTRRMDEEMPERWVRKLEELSESGATFSPSASESVADKESEREPKLTDEQINEWISSEGRDEDKDPNIDNANTGVEVIGPQKIKLKTIEGYIKMIYGGAESVARARGDFIAADTIHAYTPEYTEAWIDYIRFDSRILKYLEMFQVGTPLGNLIGIHAISIGAYVLARVTAQELARNAVNNGNGEQEI